MHRECFAVVWEIILLCHFFEVKCFPIRTNHEALRWILTLGEASRNVARWRLGLSEIDFDVVNCGGINNQAADALSGLTTVGDEVAVLTVSQAFFACVQMMEITDFEFTEESRDQFVRFVR